MTSSNDKNKIHFLEWLNPSRFVRLTAAIGKVWLKLHIHCHTCSDSLHLCLTKMCTFQLKQTVMFDKFVQKFTFVNHFFFSYCLTGIFNYTANLLYVNPMPVF